MNVMYLISSYFLGVFAKFKKTTIIFVMSARPPVWNNLALTLDGFS